MAVSQRVGNKLRTINMGSVWAQKLIDETLRWRSYKNPGLAKKKQDRYEILIQHVSHVHPLRDRCLGVSRPVMC